MTSLAQAGLSAHTQFCEQAPLRRSVRLHRMNKCDKPYQWAKLPVFLGQCLEQCNAIANIQNLVLHDKLLGADFPATRPVRGQRLASPLKGNDAEHDLRTKPIKRARRTVFRGT